MHGSVCDVPLSLFDGCIGCWMSMHDLGRDLRGFVLSMCWTQGLLHPTLDVKLLRLTPLHWISLEFFIIVVAQLIME